MTGAAAVLAAAGAAWAAQTVTHCPEGSRPSRTLEQRRPWACVLDGERYQDGVDCPAGTRSVTTDEAASPFKCAREDVVLTAPRGICPPGETAVPSDDEAKPYACEPVGRGFLGGPRCPKGTRPVPTPGSLQAFKCTAEPKGADPAPAARPDFAPPPEKAKPPARTPAPKGGACPKGTRRVVTENPFEPVQCLPEEETSAAPLSFRPFKIAGAVSFDVPRGWNVSDGWKDAEPTVHAMADRGRDGRPVSLTVTRLRRGQSGYVDLETRIWQEEDWHAAKEIGRSREGGRLSVHLEAPGESRLTLVTADDGYFAIAYGAPPELYPRYLPAFERAVKSFRNLEGR